MAVNVFAVKGEPVRVFEYQQLNALSDIPVDCTRFNAVTVEVTVTGSSPSATLSLEGAPESGGNYLPLPDRNSSQSSVSANTAFDCGVGSPWVKARLASISGTFTKGQGYTVKITPFVSPAQGRLTVG